MINQNRPQLYREVVNALHGRTGDEINSRLAAISLHHQAAAPATNVYQAPQTVAPRQQARTATPHAATNAVRPAPVSPHQAIKASADASREILDTNSQLFTWCANHIRSKHPDYSERQILMWVRNLTPDARMKMKQLFTKEHHTDAQR
jgi:hypothetical protein